MADSNKRTIVIASVLKPVDDSRMYEKIGCTLAGSGKYEVHIIGCESSGKKDPTIQQHAFKPFRRVSLRRLITPWRILFKTLRLKPDILIITTHELLYQAVLLKLFRRCRILYDVQENYFWNILYTPAFPLLIKPFVALYVRTKEAITAKFVDHFLLAEIGYELELKFPGNRKTVLENKVRIAPEERRTPVPLKSKKTIDLLFSGTLAETTGVFTAIGLAIKLHNIDERIKLTIIGYCAQPPVLEKIRLLLKPRHFIELVTKDSPLPHSAIVEQIKKADFGLICYQINPSTMNAIPTKLYEYLGFRLPILLGNHKPWMDFCNPYSAAAVFDPAKPDVVNLYKEMMGKTFFTSEPVGVYWEEEAEKLLRVVGELAER